MESSAFPYIYSSLTKREFELLLEKEEQKPILYRPENGRKVELTSLVENFGQFKVAVWIGESKPLEVMTLSQFYSLILENENAQLSSSVPYLKDWTYIRDCPGKVMVF
jgi:hypothetical protein